MIRTRRFQRLAAIATAIVMLMTLMAPTVLAAKPAPKVKPPVDIQILALNDFHGQLEVVNPISSSGGRIGSLQGGPLPIPPNPPFTCTPGGTPNCIPAGGVEYLATHVELLRAQNPKNTVFVSAGDLIGATPLLSALFHDEPTIEAFNLMGLDYNGVGNHEFDEGVDELLRVAYGSNIVDGYTPARPDGCHPVDFCADGDPYNGADFPFLAANVVYRDSGDTIFPPYRVHNFNGTKVAFVGMTLEGTPLIVSPGGIASVNFLDEAESVNALVPHLKRRGVEAIVVLLHEGGVAGPGAGGPNTGNVSLINTCDNPRGPIADVVQAMDPEIDIVITGHTNWAVNCPNLFGKVVTGAGSQGRLITEIDAKVDRTTGDFVPGSIVVNNRIVTQDVAKAPKLTALIAEYKVFEGPIAAVVVGEVVGLLDRNVRTAAGESTLGRLIADAQLASSVAAGAGGQIAFMNPGGIRGNLEGVVTHGEAFGVQPFSNIVTTKTMTGAQIKTVLEQQFTLNSLANPGAVGANPRTVANRVILSVSKGFTYTWTESAALGSKVSNMALNGIAIDPAGTYRVTMNNFIGAGGDDLPAFTLGTNEITGADDLVALEAYLGLAANRPYTPDPVARISVLP